MSDKNAVKAEGKEKVVVKSVEGPGNFEEGDVLVPQFSKEFIPKESKRPYKDRDGKWISFYRKRNGEDAGPGKVRVRDGLHINSSGQETFIEAE